MIGNFWIVGSRALFSMGHAAWPDNVCSWIVRIERISNLDFELLLYCFWTTKYATWQKCQLRRVPYNTSTYMESRMDVDLFCPSFLSGNSFSSLPIFGHGVSMLFLYIPVYIFAGSFLFINEGNGICTIKACTWNTI